MNLVEPTLHQILRQDFLEDNRIPRKLFDKCLDKTLRTKCVGSTHHWSEHIPTYFNALKQTKAVLDNLINQELSDREELCDNCPCTEYGQVKINTAPYNLCEGCACDKALNNYLDDVSDEEWTELVKELSENEL